MKKRERKDRMFKTTHNRAPRAVGRKICGKPKRRRGDYLKVLCWIIVPVIICALVVLDALGIYAFTTERLVVLGVGLLLLLLPFFSEITVKDISVKRNKTKDGT